MHKVKCRWCGQHFDTDSLSEHEWIMPSRNQYYHTKCWSDKQNGKIRPEENQDGFLVWKLNIFDFIERDLKGDCNYTRITQQMKQYKNQFPHWTYKGMFFALKWFYEIKRNNWDKANGGLGILPYIYDEGTEYWRQQERIKQGTVQKIQQQLEQRKNREQVKIKKKRKTQKTKFNLEDF